MFCFACAEKERERERVQVKYKEKQSHLFVPLVPTPSTIILLAFPPIKRRNSNRKINKGELLLIFSPLQSQSSLLVRSDLK